MNPNRGQNSNDNVWVMVSRYVSLAMLLPASVFTGYVIGYGLDLLFHTTFLRIVFLIVGIASGFLQLIRALMKELREGEK